MNAYAIFYTVNACFERGLVSVRLEKEEEKFLLFGTENMYEINFSQCMRRNAWRYYFCFQFHFFIKKKYITIFMFKDLKEIKTE